MKRFLLIVIFFGYLGVDVFASNFVAVQNGAWADGATWGNASPGTVNIDFPGEGDDVYTNGFIVTTSSTQNCRDLFIQYDVAGGLTFSSGLMIVGGSIIGWDGAEFGFPTAITANVLSGTSQFRFTGTGIGLSDDASLWIFNNEVIAYWNNNAPISTAQALFGIGNNGTIDSNGFDNSVIQFNNLTVISGTLSISGSVSALEVGNNFVVQTNGTVLSNVPVYGVSGSSSLLNTLNINGILEMRTSGAYVNSNNFTLGSASVFSTAFNGADQTQGWWFQSSAPSAFNMNTGSTVIYSANSSQDIWATTYSNLEIRSGGSSVNKTLTGAGNLVIGGEFLISQNSVTFISENTNPITFQGDVTNNGTWTTTQRIDFLGTADQAISGNNSITFGEEVRINKTSGTVSMNLVDQTINSDLRIISGTFAPLARTVLLSGNIINDGTIQATTNGTGGFIFNGTTVISGAGTTQFRNLTIDNGATLTASADIPISITTNFTNNGTFNNNSGTLAFEGTGTKSIGGSSATTLFNVNVTGGTAQVTGADIRLANILTLSSGTTFDADGSGSGVFTLLSSSTRDAAIATIPADATFSGNITVQRAIYTVNGDNKGFHIIGFPASNVSVADLQNELAITGVFTGSSTGTGFDTNPSLYAYDENAGASLTLNERYVAFPSSSNTETFTVGEGYHLYTYPGAAPVTVDGRGVLHTGNFSQALTFTGTDPDAGWNSIANPYPAPTDWSQWVNSGIEASTAHIYNTSTGAYIAYDGSGEQLIPQGQGFFVRATSGGGSVSATEATKVTGSTPTYYRQSTPLERFEIVLLKDTIEDIGIVAFNENATDSYEATYDATRLLNTFETLSTLSSDGRKLKVNRLGKSSEENSCSRSIYLSLEQMVNEKDYQLIFRDIDHLPGYSFKLIDHFLGESTIVENGKAITFNVTSDAASKGSTRFELVLETNQPQAVSVADVTTCFESSATFEIEQTESFATYYIYKGIELLNTLEGTGASVSAEIAADYLSSGDNELTIKASNSGCDTLEVASFNAFMDSSLDLNRAVSGSSVCSGVEMAPYSVATEVGVSYYLTNSTDTLAILEGNGGVIDGTITVSLLSAGTNTISILAQKEGCESGTLTSEIEIIVDDLAIDQSIAYFGSTICENSEASFSINTQNGITYEIYDGTKKVLTLNGNGETIASAIPRDFLGIGENSFTIKANYGECEEFTFTEALVINIQKSINTALNVSAEDICSGGTAQIVISNTEIDNTYWLIQQSDTLSGKSGTTSGELTFEVGAELLSIGENQLEIGISNELCGAFTSDQSINISVYEQANIYGLENSIICKGESLAIEVQSNFTLSNYQLTVNDEVVHENSTGLFNISPEESTTYEVKGISSNGCTSNVLGFSVTVEDLATPEIEVSGNILQSSVEANSYQWYKNGELLSGENNSILIVNESGNYSVEISNGVCTKISESYIFEEEVLSNAEKLEAILNIYPNPVEKDLTIEFADKELNQLKIAIFTLSGQFINEHKVKRSGEKVDMSGLKRGTYLIQIITEKGTLTQRVIKK
ncbi:T9SS type A sorting domain-containing protein [Marivirga sp. S37H4]|uniref:T9SS type A sorting domain-containing protein n=1 Tax=Marivirga aurantiaca TaxID=2802615 RepID=A0A934WXA5_9BACT|nr:T9SS type A sorting domain-containing protein [Marivirga aurantiaca]MBK6264824.1 T9SS type A sorting domain-containing protein [Marivirga aurantiaca]